MVKCLPAVRETQVRSLGGEDPLEKEIATHSSTLAWKIPWTEEPGGLQSMESQRVGHDWVTSLSLFTLDVSKEVEKERISFHLFEGTVTKRTWWYHHAGKLRADPGRFPIPRVGDHSKCFWNNFRLHIYQLFYASHSPFLTQCLLRLIHSCSATKLLVCMEEITCLCGSHSSNLREVALIM